MKMKNYYITFGQAHPNRDGWVRVVAESRKAAKEIADERLKDGYSIIYEEDEHEESFFPLGELKFIKA